MRFHIHWSELQCHLVIAPLDGCFLVYATFFAALLKAIQQWNKNRVYKIQPCYILYKSLKKGGRFP